MDDPEEKEVQVYRHSKSKHNVERCKYMPIITVTVTNKAEELPKREELRQKAGFVRRKHS